jgi:hypothetical protein
MIEAFPLSWPIGFERSAKKQDSNFACTVAQARDGVLKQLRLLGGINPIISSNVPLKRDGQMYSNERPVDGDTGIAVYWTWKNEQFVMACDKYYKLHENLRAIEKSIEALRGLERWGASDILARAFTGFKVLPAGGTITENWWEVLDVKSTAKPEQIRDAYRRLSKVYHPDVVRTGDRNEFERITKAYRQGIQGR